MRLIVVDTETTGDSETDQVCEIAVRSGVLNGSEPRLKECSSWHHLIRPTVPVQPEARAAHHIPDHELADKPTMADLMQTETLMGGLRGGGASPLDDRVLVGHYVAFDRRLLAQSAYPSELHLPMREICTYRCSLQIWPDFPKHSNQALRYRLGIEVAEDGTPHRAAHDVEVTEGILLKMLEEHTVEDLIRMTTEPALLGTCRIGEHAGKPWSEVDEGFLTWLLSKGPRRPNPRGGRDIGFSTDERHTAQYWLNQKQKERADADAASRKSS